MTTNNNPEAFMCAPPGLLLLLLLSCLGVTVAARNLYLKNVYLCAAHIVEYHTRLLYDGEHVSRFSRAVILSPSCLYIV